MGRGGKPLGQQAVAAVRPSYQCSWGAPHCAWCLSAESTTLAQASWPAPPCVRAGGGGRRHATDAQPAAPAGVSHLGGLHLQRLPAVLVLAAVAGGHAGVPPLHGVIAQHRSSPRHQAVAQVAATAARVHGVGPCSGRMQPRVRSRGAAPFPPPRSASSPPCCSRSLPVHVHLVRLAPALELGNVLGVGS